MTEVPGNGLGAMGSQQVVNIFRVDSENNQALFEWHGCTDRLKHRAVQAHQSKPLGPLPPERVQRQ